MLHWQIKNNRPESNKETRIKQFAFHFVWRKIFPLRTVDMSSRICSDTLKTTRQEWVQEEKRQHEMRGKTKHVILFDFKSTSWMNSAEHPAKCGVHHWFEWPVPLPKPVHPWNLPVGLSAVGGNNNFIMHVWPHDDSFLFQVSCNARYTFEGQVLSFVPTWRHFLSTCQVHCSNALACGIAGRTPGKLYTKWPVRTYTFFCHRDCIF